MGERLSRFTLMAGTYHGDFEFLEKLKTRVEQVSVASLKTFVETKLIKPEALPQLSFFYRGPEGGVEPTPESLVEIKDYQGFSSSMTRHQPYKLSKSLK